MDDDYDYRQTQREHRTRVIVGIGTALAVVAMLVVRFGMRRERDAVPVPVYVPTPSVPSPALAAPREPVEFELVAGGHTYDVVPDRAIELEGGAGRIELETNPTWRTTAEGYHFTHRSSVSVAQMPEMVIASTDGAILKLQRLDAKRRDADLREELSFTVTGTGQTVGAPVPTTRTIAGKPREGVRHRTTTAMQVEVYLVQVGKLKLGALLYIEDPSAELAKLDALLDSIAEGPGEPLPHFTLRARGVATPLQVVLDTAVEVPLAPPVTVTIRRRATVLRTMVGNGGSLTFEHPRGIAVSQMPNDQMLAVTIQTERAAIQLFDLQMRFTVEELKTTLMGQIAATDLGEVTHTKDGQTVRGRKLHLEQLPVEHELYVFERGGKTIGASIQYVATDEQAAIDAALPILLSVH